MLHASPPQTPIGSREIAPIGCREMTKVWRDK